MVAGKYLVALRKRGTFYVMKSVEQVLTCGASGVVYASTFGGHIALGYRKSLDESAPQPITYSDSFDLASITKIMSTTAIVMELVKAKELKLSDRASTYLPQWKSEKAEITIEDLLRHRSGLPPWRPLYIRHSTAEAAHETIARDPLSHPVNTGRAYSDLGFISLGLIISTITGKDFLTSFHELIAQPFGLTQTRFATPVTEAVSTSRGDRFEKEMVETNIPFQVPESAEEFSGWRKEILTGEINDGNAFHLFKGISSHAGLFSTAQDVLTFSEEISQHSLFPLFTEEGPDQNAHLGFMSWVDTVDGCTDTFYGHTGFTGGAFGISRAHGEVVVLLANRLHTDGSLTPTSTYFAQTLHEAHSHLH